MQLFEAMQLLPVPLNTIRIERKKRYLFIKGLYSYKADQNKKQINLQQGTNASAHSKGH